MTDTVKQKSEKRLYRFFVPYMDSKGEEIPADKREKFIEVIKTESCKRNGGFTAFEAEGGYQNNKDEMMCEKITVIETYGELPLSPERMENCSIILAQESLIVMSVDGYEFMDFKGNSGKP